MTILSIIIAGCAAALVIAILFLLSYVKSPNDKATIITGWRSPRILIGRSGICIPFLERKDMLDLQLIQVDVETKSLVPTADYINIKVDAVVNAQIGLTDSMIFTAASKLLNKDIGYIRGVIQNVLEGSIREIVGKMNLTDMVKDREKFNMLVKENAETDLNALGLTIKTFNVQNFIDKDSVIENMGVDNIVRIKKDAAVSRANAEKDIATAQAAASKLANDARVASETEIAVKNTALDIRKSELKNDADVKRAAADSAYGIQKAAQAKTLNETEVMAQIAAQEKTVELRKKEAEVAEQTLNAQIRKKADAEKYRVQAEAEANLYRRTQEAEAQKVEQLRNAEALKAKAEAEKYAQLQSAEAIRAKGEAEADAIKAKGCAEASAIEAKSLAEAKGIDKKAEAMQKMKEAAIAEMYFKAMPEIARNIAEPMSKIGSITMFGDGNSTKMMSDITGVLNQVMSGLGAGTGLDVKSLIAGAFGQKCISSVAKSNTCTAVSEKCAAPGTSSDEEKKSN